MTAATLRPFSERLKGLLVRRRCLHDFRTVLSGLIALTALLFREPRLALRRMAMAIRLPRQGGAGRSALLGTLVARKFDIVHFELSGIGVAYLPMLDLLRPARMFVGCRGAAEQIKPLVTPARGPNLEELFRRADRVNCVSQDILESCKKYGLTEQKAFVNRPAIQSEAFTRTSPITRTRLPNAPVRICSTGLPALEEGLRIRSVGYQTP